jgi:HlyD family secretion protein
VSLEQPEAKTEAPPLSSLKKDVRLGLIVIAFIVLGLGGLAATVKMAGAVVGIGEVAVESKIKQVQHPTGGVVSRILVKNGDPVVAGQILMQLDTTVSEPSANLTGVSVDQLMARQARLEAEREGRSAVTFPAELTRRSGEAEVRAAMRDETQLFQLRATSRNGQLGQLRERVAQLEQQILGYTQQANASREQARYIEEELKSARELYEKRLTTIQRLNALERGAAELKGNAGALEANIAQARAGIAEIRQQMIALEQEGRSQAGVELAEVQQRLAELQRNQVMAEDHFERSLIRAPQAGVVDGLAFNTVGGVIPPGETIMQIVPTADRLQVEARISPADVDQLHPNQPATLRFSAFDRQSTPEIEGRVQRVSAERVVDERSGASFYTVVIGIPEGELRKLGSLKLVPGMPVEAFIQTGKRTMLNYISKPLVDQINRSFREG